MQDDQVRPRRRSPTCCAAIALAVAMLVWPRAGAAFQVNTCLRDLTYIGKQLGQEPHGRRVNLCGSAPPRFQFAAVHEHMTAFAVAEYRGIDHWNIESDRQGVYRYLVESRWPKGAEHTHRTRDIIYGSWWNDDPLMLMWGQGWDLINGMRSMEAFFKPASRYPSALRDGTVNAQESLVRHSHFERLQHLHFMTRLPMSSDLRLERLNTTTEKALQWMKFAFEVATRKEGSKPSDKFDSARARELGLPSLAPNFGVKPSNVRIRTLFARSGVSDRDTRTPDVALGSMLHIIQDSFSPAHTCRVVGLLDGKRSALLRDVYNYNGQDEVKHKKLDGVPGWLDHYAKTGEHYYANDPVAVGAWLIGAVDRDLEWKEVEAYLRSTVFAVIEPSEDRPSTSCLDGQP